ncbi:hypothetical protein Ddye_025965 [Dipteronia dyeriana]|uniref:Uncharacterized protein n=1 Tax=Dipteronia dyeriana TaxID=168575 RepID=A0AAD9TME3_9ROSI|nr:hypothetical protein Ddye_025965 [Dipteronia dyeriana]
MVTLFGMLIPTCVTLTVNAEHAQRFTTPHVLNWQSHNAIVQNGVLNSIDQKIERVTQHVSQHDHHLQSLDEVLRDMFTDLHSRIAKLDANPHRYINHGYFGQDLAEKREKSDNTGSSWNK